MQPETILAILCLVTVLVEYLHAKDEQYYAFARGTMPQFTGIDFSRRAELLSSSKTESAFIVYKVMMRILFILLCIFILPYAWAKLFGYCLIGIYFLYQHHHLYEWYVLKKENHGRRTAWMFTLITIVWWWQVVKMIIVYFSTGGRYSFIWISPAWGDFFYEVKNNLSVRERFFYEIKIDFQIKIFILD